MRPGHSVCNSPWVLTCLRIWFDWRAGRLRWPFPFTFVWLAVAYATLFPGWHSVWFDHLCKAIAATA